MPYSANGWSIRPDLISRYTVPGSDIKVALRRGDVSVILLEVLRRYHKEVEPLKQKDTGGYAYRRIRGATRFSNHASGTAIDTRWQDHPLGARGTFSTKERAAIRKILKDMGGVVRWGGDYSGRPDEMHFEINKGPAAVKALANRIRARRAAKPPAPKRPAYSLPAWKYGDDGTRFGPYDTGVPPFYQTVQDVQRKLYSLGYDLDANGRYGPATKRAVLDFQRKHKLDDDALIGKLTYTALRDAR